MRYTQSEVRGMFSRLVKAMGEEVIGSCYNTPTDDLVYVNQGLQLDYAPVYGGYVIEKIGLEGGCDHPFGSLRRNAREMYLSMHMAAQALENQRYKQEQLNKYEVA